MVMRGDEIEPIWQPDAEQLAQANISAFMQWVSAREGAFLESYQQLWAWSVADIDRFWRAIWDYFELGPTIPPGSALASNEMPGARWFPDQSLNFAQILLERAPKSGPALIYFNGELKRRDISRDELASDVHRLAAAMREAGIVQGDRVVACLPNIPEAMIAMLACATMGAIWSVVSPETGSDGMLARFAQLEPKLLITSLGYRFRGTWMDRREDISRLVEGLPSLARVVTMQGSEGGACIEADIPSQPWHLFLETGRAGGNAGAQSFAEVPFDHPLWVLFSSGTTGIPKAMVQSHGGITLEMLKNGALQLDLHPGDRMFFYTITGWMVWNIALGAMLAGAATVLYDGQPNEPDLSVLWTIAERSDATIFGGSPAYQNVVAQSGFRPRDQFAFPALRSILLSGSPASGDCMRWFLDAVKPDLWVQSACGGTDVCTSFVGGAANLPLYAGEIQARGLGVDAAVLDPDGAALIGEVGELVIRQPMPSMPTFLWNDVGDTRYRETYFDHYPGIWRQGDFARINARGGVHVLGRSDATLNRQGVRIGTAEIYSALGALPQVSDALMLGVDRPDGTYWMPLFVVLADGYDLDAALDRAIRGHIKSMLSPRHVPDAIFVVPAIPYTRTGKRLEVPLRRILSGTPLETALAREAVADMAAITAILEIAESHG